MFNAPCKFLFGVFMIALTDNRISQDSLAELRKRGFEVLLMPPSASLQSGVSSHTDMLVFVGFGKLICHEEYYKSNVSLIERIAGEARLEITLSREQWSSNYPYDVLFNACLVGKRLICNKKTVSRLILDEAKSQEYNIINVPQGYTKCSVCIISDNAIITSDKAIASACSAVGIDVLTVSEGHISLPPYSFGFIGGVGGTCGDNVYFCGSLDTHPDGDRIKDFCQKHGKRAVCLSDGELQDVGSLFFI